MQNGIPLVLTGQRVPSYLDVEALDVVVSHPLSALVCVGDILRGIPHLSGSILQEGADLKTGG